MPPKKDENKAKFIEAIRGFSFLWDLTDDDYKNKKKVDEKWADLASEFGYEGKLTLKLSLLNYNLDGDLAKGTWKNIKDAYTNSKKALASGGRPKKPYVFATEMSFMDSVKESQR